MIMNTFPPYIEQQIKEANRLQAKNEQAVKTREPILTRALRNVIIAAFFMMDATMLLRSKAKYKEERKRSKSMIRYFLY